MGSAVISARAMSPTQAGGYMDILTVNTVSSCEQHTDDRFLDYVAGGLWQPTRTGNYRADCRHGRELADHIIWRMRRDNNPLHLSVAVRAAVESGRWEGVEIGLFQALAEMVM